MNLTVKKAAEHAGVSRSLVYAWCRDRLPHQRLGRIGKRGSIRIRLEDLEAFLQQCWVKRVRAETERPAGLQHITLR